MYISQVSGERLQDHWSSGSKVRTFEPHREKTGFLPMRKQMRRSPSQ